MIHHIETYDVTTVRASTPMYLMARKIKAMGVKMVFIGEVFGGYLCRSIFETHFPGRKLRFAGW